MSLLYVLSVSGKAVLCVSNTLLAFGIQMMADRVDEAHATGDGLRLQAPFHKSHECSRSTRKAYQLHE